MPSVITIFFRGLLVFHQVVGATGLPVFEVGFLSEKGHFPRIVTIRDGVRESTKCLFPDQGGFQEEDCVFQKPPTSKVVWELKIDNVDDPTGKGAHPLRIGPGIGPKGDRIDRKTNPPVNKQDFRWILNLENDEFNYGNLTGQLAISKLVLVLKIPAGEFSTKLLSPHLYKHFKGDTGPVEDFGPIAGVIACKINVKSGGAKLMGTGLSAPIPFSSESEDPGVTYEISNSPPDTATMPEDHFHLYYDLFSPNDQYFFSISRDVIHTRGPNPALCGEIYLGQSSDSLESNTLLKREALRNAQPRKKRKTRPGGTHKH